MHGWHCKICISAEVKAADKLSTGYGFTGEGESRVMVSVPSSQKLVLHEKKDQHKNNVTRVVAQRGAHTAG